MKLIDAFWEKRNLGVSCLEVEVEEKDSKEDLISVQPQMDKVDYIVVKIPTGRFDLQMQLQSMGFIFAEASFAVTCDLKTPPTGILARLNQQISSRLMDEKDHELLFTRMYDHMFDTDRIYLDPYFSNEQAAYRYICWIKDEIAKGTEVFSIVYKDQDIGFYTFKDLGKGVYYPFLASLYAEYRQSGLGFSIIQEPIEQIIKRGGKQLSTYVSSNNPAIFKLQQVLGFKLDHLNCVFVKHNNMSK